MTYIMIIKEQIRMNMKEILFVILLLIIFTIVGTLELMPEETHFDRWYAMPECTVEVERGDVFLMEVTAYTSCPSETD